MSHIWTSEVTSHGGEKHLQSVCSLTWLVIKQTYLRSLLLFCKKYPHNIFIRYCIFSDFVRSLVLSCPNVSLCGYVELKMTMRSLKHWNELLGRLQNPESSSITVVDSHVSRFVVMTADSVRWWPLGAVEKLGPDLELTCFICFQLWATPLDVLSFHRGDECVLQHHTPKKIKLFNTFLGGLNFVTAPEQTGDMLENLLRIMWYEMRTSAKDLF